MTRIIFFLSLTCLVAFFSQCKKHEKLENPFGLLALGSDTSLPDGRYVIRSTAGCGGTWRVLHCDYTDGAIGLNGSLMPVDHIYLNETDTAGVWYVKKVRYVSPDPDYALAFGYRIYQRMSDGQYRFLAFASTASPLQWTDDEIGFTYGDGGSKTAKVNPLYLDYYPHDPAVPTSFSTSNDTIPVIDTRYLFQLYASQDYPGGFRIRAGGIKSHSAAPAVFRWNFCMAYFENNGCEVEHIYPHFRSDDPVCETWRENGDESRRCYIKDYYFQKVY